MGHARQVRVDRVAEDVAPEDHRQRHVERLEAAVVDEIAQVHRHAAIVGELEADAVLARDGRDDAHLLGEREGEIIGQRGDLGDLGAGGGRDLEGGDGGTGEDVLDLA